MGGILWGGEANEKNVWEGHRKLNTMEETLLKAN